ncbi:MAG: sugar MFS transporter [Bacteroidales bacterium]|nr:sugar MFS transporter [Bacteroidales bacterium]
MEQITTKKYVFPILVLLFFMWGFLTCMNDILIPYLKTVFMLNHTQAMVIQFAFFGSYFIGSLIYYISSNIFGDPINKIGYKYGIICGLLTSALGTSIFYPAVILHSYGVFLLGLFILGLGFTILQISANPYVAIIGDARTASARLNLAQGFNSFGTAIAPLLGGYWVFTYFSKHQQNSADALIAPYLLFTCVFLFIAILFFLVKLPVYKAQTSNNQVFTINQYPHLIWGIVAIFMYVGAEVSIGSMLISFLKLPYIGNMTEAMASKYVSLYWTGLMLGRFLGAIFLDNKHFYKKIFYALLVCVGGFGFITYIHSLNIAVWYSFIVIIASGILYFAKKPQISLTIFSLSNMLLLILVVLLSGNVVVWCIIITGLFNSIMWSNIFTLSIHNLGIHTPKASSLLVMAIVGGAILPLLMGVIADNFNVQWSFIVPFIGYIYLTFFGIKSFKLVKL